MAHPEKRDLEATEKQILAWLPKAVPEGHGFALRNLRSPSSTGFSSDTLLFDLAWEDGQGQNERPVVMRLEPHGFNVFPTYDLAIQYDTLRALAGTPVPVPEVLWVETDPAPLDAPFYVMGAIEGWAPSDTPPMHKEGTIAEMPPAEREAVWWSGVEAMAKVHAVDWQKQGFEWLRERQPGGSPLDRQLAYYEHYFDWGLGDRERHPIIVAALDYLRRNEPADEPERICWGDSRLSNLLFRGTEVVAVLDWEMAFLGNPVQDVAWWNMADLCFTEGIGLPRLEGLPTHEETTTRWHEISGLSTDRMRYYEILALFRFAIIMARIGLQMEHYEVLPAGAEFGVKNLASETLARRLVIAGM